MRILGQILVLCSVALVAAPLSAEAPAPAGRGGIMEGTAALGRRVPAAGATVAVRSGAPPSEVWLTTTDGKGFFRVKGLPDGVYSLEISRDGLSPVLKPGVEVRFPYRAIVEVTLSAGEPRPSAAGPAAPATGEGIVRLEGRVADRDGAPLAEARVRLARDDRPDDPRTALTGPDGGFEIAGIPRGVWRVEVLGAGYLPIRTTFPVGRDLRLEASLVPQPASHVPLPLDLIPPEEAIPPP